MPTIGPSLTISAHFRRLAHSALLAAIASLLLFEAAHGQAVAPPNSSAVAPSLRAFPPRLSEIGLDVDQLRDGTLAERLRLPPPAQSHRGRHALLGGLIGGVSGVIACTAISNLVNDAGTGFSTCDTKAYLGFGLGGAAIGAVIGALVK